MGPELGRVQCNYLSVHGRPPYQVPFDSSSDRKYAALHNLDSSSDSKSATYVTDSTERSFRCFDRFQIKPLKDNDDDWDYFTNTVEILDFS